MRNNSQLGTSSDNFGYIEWFSCGNDYRILDPPFYVQDPTHIITKLRNFILKTRSATQLLPFGDKYFIQLDHLKSLLTTFSKCEHLLSATALNPTDRQSFSTALKMCNERVADLLRANVENSEGTIKCLEIMRNVMSAYMEKDIPPLERVRKMWFSLFIVRLWREYILKSKNFKLKDNFLTSNCYYCIELNAHSLVLILVYLKENSLLNMFIPLHYSSQPCESLFRQVRSYTSTYSTVANCSVKEILGRLTRIQLQADIAVNYSEDFTFPRSISAHMGQKLELPTRAEIYEEIEKCKIDALEYAERIGLVKENRCKKEIPCKCVPYEAKKVNTVQNISSPNDVISSRKELLLKSLIRPLCRENSLLHSYVQKFSEKPITENGPYASGNN